MDLSSSGVPTLLGRLLPSTCSPQLHDDSIVASRLHGAAVIARKVDRSPRFGELSPILASPSTPPATRTYDLPCASSLSSHPWLPPRLPSASPSASLQTAQPSPQAAPSPLRSTDQCVLFCSPVFAHIGPHTHSLLPEHALIVERGIHRDRPRLLRRLLRRLPSRLHARQRPVRGYILARTQ